MERGDSREPIIVDINARDAVRRVETAVQLGMPILLEGVGQAVATDGGSHNRSSSAVRIKDAGRKEVDLPAWLEPLLRHNVRSQGGRHTVQVGGSTIDYAKGFRLYLLTKSSSSALRLSAETQTLVTVVEFSVTWDGLRD